MIIARKNVDIYGFLIKVMICAIMWYKEVIQYKFYTGEYVFIILGVVLASLVVIDYSKNLKRHIFRFPKALLYIISYIIFTFLFGTVTTPNAFYHNRYGIIMMGFALVMIFVYYYCITRRSYEFIIWNYLAIYIFMLIVFFAYPETVRSGGGIRYSFSKSLNPNSFAVGLSTGTWAILYFISQRKIKLLIGFPICGFMIYAIFLSGSRKGLIGTVLCIALWFVSYYIPLRGNNGILNVFIKIVVVITIIFAMILILLPYFSDSIISTRMQNIFKDDSYISRIQMYKYGIQLLKKSPLFGYGFWGFAIFYGVYSHSTIIECIVSSGIPISLIYFASYIEIFKNLFALDRLYKKKWNKNLIIIRHFLILFFMMVLYTVCVIHFYDLCYFINCGMITALYTLKKKKLYV